MLELLRTRDAPHPSLLRIALRPQSVVLPCRKLCGGVISCLQAISRSSSGTTKGAFLISGGSDRSGWTVTGPHCDGWPINHVVGDPETGTIWAGGGGDWHGAGVWRSDDGGESWQVTRLTEGQDGRLGGQRPGFRQDDRLDRRGAALSRTPSLRSGRLPRPRHAYAGTKPANLLQSRDGGRTWDEIDGLTDHPSAASWNPGRCGTGAAHDRAGSGQPRKSSGSASRRPASSPPRTAARPGSAATAFRTPRPVISTTTRPRHATARSVIACTT